MSRVVDIKELPEVVPVIAGVFILTQAHASQGLTPTPFSITALRRFHVTLQHGLSRRINEVYFQGSVGGVAGRRWVMKTATHHEQPGGSGYALIE